uniref:Uncharacterized protein n=1 Tax=Cucumis melo TaxID=3656 RepID=A0A9I9EBY9_CUCME
MLEPSRPLEWGDQGVERVGLRRCCHPFCGVFVITETFLRKAGNARQRNILLNKISFSCGGVCWCWWGWPGVVEEGEPEASHEVWVPPDVNLFLKV